MAKEPKTEKTVQEKKVTKKTYIHAVGRRKEAVARVRLHIDAKEEVMWGEQAVARGTVFVNGMSADAYFSTAAAKAGYMRPFQVTGVSYTVTAKVVGGGKTAQLGAVVHGIARALTELDKEQHRAVLKKNGFLTRDPRAKERRKVGTGGKARHKKQSPKR